MNRRVFLTALLGAPVAVKVAPVVERINPAKLMASRVSLAALRLERLEAAGLVWTERLMMTDPSIRCWLYSWEKGGDAA